MTEGELAASFIPLPRWSPDGLVMLVIPPQLSADDPLWIKIVISVLCLSLVAIAYREHRLSFQHRVGFGSGRLARGFPMSGLFKLIGLGLVFVIGYPLLNEETVSVCHSVEKRFVYSATIWMRGARQSG